MITRPSFCPNYSNLIINYPVKSAVGILARMCYNSDPRCTG
jgi:hypothetical protein